MRAYVAGPRRHHGDRGRRAGARGFVGYFELDDGRGACWLAISARQLVGVALGQQRQYMLTVASPGSDGALVYTQQIPYQPDTAPHQLADALGSDGTNV